MHHRRNRTTRREVKRMDNKSFRAAEQRALNKGVEDHPPQDRWGFRPEALPLGDVPCNGKSHGKKKASKPRDRCSQGGAHEWYYEWTEVQEFFRDILRTCDTCAMERPRWIAEHERWHRQWSISYRIWDCPYSYHWCRLHGTKRYYTVRTKIGTCLKCWKTKLVKKTDDLRELYPDRYYYGTKRQRFIPKRPVQF